MHTNVLRPNKTPIYTRTWPYEAGPDGIRLRENDCSAERIHLSFKVFIFCLYYLSISRWLITFLNWQSLTLICGAWQFVLLMGRGKQGLVQMLPFKCSDQNLMLMRKISFSCSFALLLEC